MRPRERLLRSGSEALSDAELLALVLGVGAPGYDAQRIASDLLTRFSDLRRLSLAGVAELCQLPGVGAAQACRLKAALALAGRLAERPFHRGQRVAGPGDVFERIGRRLAARETEAFVALALDSKHRVLGEHYRAEGGACSVDIVPRDLFSSALREAAAAMIFVHNHPSGDPTPSANDRALTRRLSEAGDLVGVRVLDHVVVGHQAYFSFAENRVVQVTPDSARIPPPRRFFGQRPGNR